jgi:hypothetical protein
VEPRKIRPPKLEVTGTKKRLVKGSEFALNPSNKRIMVENLTRRATQFTDDTYARGMEWYKSAQKDAYHVGAGNVDVGASVISLLSGRTNFQVNRQMALQLMTLTPEHVSAIQQHHDTVRMVNKLPGGKDHPNAAPLLAHANSLRDSVLGGTPLAKMTSGSILRAHQVISGERHPLGIFNVIGVKGQRLSGPKKQFDFAGQMRSGGQFDDFAPIDTHAYDAALDNLDVTYGTANEHMKTGPTYDFIHDAYKKALVKSIAAGHVDKGTTIGQYQAMHWVHHQTLKAAQRPGVLSGMVSHQVSALAIADKLPHLDPAKHGLDPIEPPQSIIDRIGNFAIGSGEGK